MIHLSKALLAIAAMHFAALALSWLRGPHLPTWLEACACLGLISLTVILMLIAMGSLERENPFKGGQ